MQKDIDKIRKIPGYKRVDIETQLDYLEERVHHLLEAVDAILDHLIEQEKDKE